MSQNQIPTGGYSLDLFLNQDHAINFLCHICSKVCCSPEQLNCPAGHIFCHDCIASEPHTVTIMEAIHYDPNNNSNELSVNEDLSSATQITVATTNTTCPICKVSKCSRLVCSQSIAENIQLLSVRCTNARCRWNGTLSHLPQHIQSHNAQDCPFHVFGCQTTRVSQQELMTHYQRDQMDHLQLQINAITALQNGYQQMQGQIQTLNNQQVHLTTLITEYDSKINEIQLQKRASSQMHSPNNSGNASAERQNLQFNINMNNNNHGIDLPIIDKHDRDYHRYKNNPIIDKIVNIQKAIISSQSVNNTVNTIHTISNAYTLAELSELYADINKQTPYLPTKHKKLCIVRGSLNGNSKHHNIQCIDIHNKRKYKLLRENDPIISYRSWDIEFAGLTVVQNIPTQIFQKCIKDPREQLLFSLKHGLSMKKNRNNPPNSEREQYLEQKYSEEQKNDSLKAQNCSVLLRMGGSTVDPNNNGKNGATQRVNGLVFNTGDWIASLPNLKKARYGSAAAYSPNNGVIVCGGKTENQCLNGVEQWNIVKGSREWEELPAMNEMRYSPVCTVFDIGSNGKAKDECLFVGGGWNEKDRKLSSCEIYNFENGYWTRIADMNVKRYGAGCTVWDYASDRYGSKLVVGGGHSKRACKSVEMYDKVKNVWVTLPNTNGKHRDAPAIWVCKEYGKFLSPFNGLLCIAGDLWSVDGQEIGTIEGVIEGFDHRDWRQQWFIIEDLRNILIDNKKSIVRGMIPFS